MSMSSPRALTSYKKKDGILAVASDKQSVSWTPTASSKPLVTIRVADITNLQQSPANNPKVALKIVVQPASASAPESHVFSFTSPSEAREQQVAVTDTLRNTIQASKSGSASLTTPGTPVAGNGSGKAAAMAIAQAVSGGSRAMEDLYDDARLKTDMKLQQSLLSTNPTLRQIFAQTRREKPESMNEVQFAVQFWSTSSRLALLRAHQAEKVQQQGEYNVLSEVKTKNVDGKSRLSLSKEQIQLIFKQHPIVRRAYNENVPPLDESEYWSRFFVSRLFRKLKGERITDQDPIDVKLDKYINMDEELERGQQNAATHVTRFIDLEGNEQNHSQRQGNRPDEYMRPSSHDRVPIFRTLNNTSEKILARVTAADGELHAPIGLDEAEFEELRLRDLQADAEDNRVFLTIKDRQRFLAGERDDETSAEAALYAQQDPQTVLSDLRAEINNGALDLNRATSFASDDSDSEDDESAASAIKKSRINSKPALAAATTAFFSAVRTRRAQPGAADPLDPADLSAPSSTFPPLSFEGSGLSSSVLDTLKMTHATSNEFLHYFYAALASADAGQAASLPGLLEALDNSLKRIAAVAETAETERALEVEKRKRQLAEWMQRTGKKRRFDAESVGGGRVAVQRLERPTVGAIEVARVKYRSAVSG
ncbi:hypothetical protein B0A49_09470 [Cryomyces minteri]|uniref:BSD domain-containing protein n=1 Tax=Cryomyces minteri TaxID=331657 RepID=A0A4U0WNX4_9PEZI|nr:hypothetical protein B0A49_09470 [Cryomyces minteri]